ncbi:MAG TPA: hypothetical protein VFU23_07770 [Gemmatimonadales bacterium]|nr:hypothetical protein [Gemmatimonadales bacterium]
MPLPDPKSHRISLDEAIAQARRFREALNRGDLFSRKEKGGLFLRKEVDELLAQPGCAGLRFYYGRNAAGGDTVILVGADANGNDMTKGVVLEDHFLCPPFCGDASPLNA